MVSAEAEVADQIQGILGTYDLECPIAAADALRELWLQFEPKSVAGIKAEQREKQEMVGIPVKVLRPIGRERRSVESALKALRRARGCLMCGEASAGWRPKVWSPSGPLENGAVLGGTARGHVGP